jgi:excisionase family DNA binding protein
VILFTGTILLPGDLTKGLLVEIAVSEAAERLGLDESRVRQLLRANRLEGRLLGRVWLVSSRDVARLEGQHMHPGRPMAPARAWGLLDLLEGGRAPWLSPVARSQVRDLGRRAVGSDASRWRSLLRCRSDVHRCRAHRAALERLLTEPAVRLGGAAEAARLGADLTVPSGCPELYASEEVWSHLVGSLHLRERSAKPVADLDDEPDVIVRVPRLWPFEGSDGPGLAALAADLLDAPDPRAVSAGSATLNELSAKAFA